MPIFLQHCSPTSVQLLQERFVCWQPGFNQRYGLPDNNRWTKHHQNMAGKLLLLLYFCSKQTWNRIFLFRGTKQSNRRQTCKACGSAASRLPRRVCWWTAGGTPLSGTAPADTAAWRRPPLSGSTPQTQLEEQIKHFPLNQKQRPEESGSRAE